MFEFLWPYLLIYLTILICRTDTKGGGRGMSGARGAISSGGARAGGSLSARGGGYGGTGTAAASGASRISYRPITGGMIGSAALGASVGLASGAAIGHMITNAYSPFRVGGRNFYWGRDYLPVEEGEVRCSRPVTDLSTDQMNDITFDDGSIPIEVAWGCSQGYSCCEWDCCNDTENSLFLFLLLTFAGVAALAGGVASVVYCSKRVAKRRKALKVQTATVSTVMNESYRDLPNPPISPPPYSPKPR